MVQEVATHQTHNSGGTKLSVEFTGSAWLWVRQILGLEEADYEGAEQYDQPSASVQFRGVK